MRTKIMIIGMLSTLIAVTASSASAQTRKGRSKQSIKAQTAKVVVSANGYQPGSFKLKKGVPARVTFLRQTDEGCGTEIALPAYNIRRALPLNKPVTVAFTPTKTGEFNFTCGMGMMRGKILVQ